jgi:NADPH:quinone reductase-like Zn-dependent oxidoreductase
MPRIVRFHRHGGPEELKIDDIAVSAPGAGEVQIRVRALGLNRAEALMRAGTYIETPALPARLGLEAAGIVAAVGADVANVAPGDIVSVIPPVSMIRYPTHGEIANLPAAHVVKHPPMLDFASAAAVWMPFLTAYGALIDLAQLRADDTVAITAASSSVGLAAIQIARSVGARAVAITRTSAKEDALRAFGADHVVVTERDDLEARLKAIAPDGIRVVLDAVSGALVTPLTAAMARGGILIAYGGLALEPTPFPLFTALGKCLTMRGYLVHEIVEDAAKLDAAKRFILDGVASGAFTPVIAKRFAFDDIVEAYRYLESNAQFGKVVVTL